MRSRYSAFCVKNLDYIVETTDPQARADMDKKSTEEWMNGAEFSKLEILKATDEGNKGTVEFKAYFKMNGADEVHHEISKFRKHGAPGISGMEKSSCRHLQNSSRLRC